MWVGLRTAVFTLEVRIMVVRLSDSLMLVSLPSGITAAIALISAVALPTIRSSTAVLHCTRVYSCSRILQV